MWYDKSGSFSVEAVLISFTEKEVVLRRTDGKTIRVPRASLSEADQRYSSVTTFELASMAR